MKTWLIIRGNKSLPTSPPFGGGGDYPKKGGLGAINGTDGWWCTTLLFLDLLVRDAWKQETHAQMVVKHGDLTRIESVKHHQLNKEKKLVSLWEGQKNPGKFTAGTLKNSPNWEGKSSFPSTSFHWIGNQQIQVYTLRIPSLPFPHKCHRSGANIVMFSTTTTRRLEVKRGTMTRAAKTGYASIRILIRWRCMLGGWGTPLRIHG